MQNIAKQQTGFKFGQHRLTALKELGKIEHKGRTYKLLMVQTHNGLSYISLRLYNGSGKFIKQLLFEPEIRQEIAAMIAAN